MKPVLDIMIPRHCSAEMKPVLDIMIPRHCSAENETCAGYNDTTVLFSRK
jgi:hypothetical protein